MTSDDGAKRRRTSYMIAIFAMVIWGTTFPLSKLVIPPLTGTIFTLIRVVFALIIFLLYIVLTNQFRAFWHLLKSNFWFFLILGGLFYGLSYSIQYYGIRYTTAINQSILSNTTTLFVIFLNFILYRRKPQRKFIIGLIIGVIGALLIMVNDEFSFSSSTFGGDLLTLLSFLFWAGYIVMSKSMSEKENSLHVFTSVLVGAFLVLLPLSFLDRGYAVLSDLTLLQWGILAYLGVICSGVATLMYTVGLSNETIPSENMSLINLILPVVAIITSILLLEEKFTWRILIGMVLILISVFIVERDPKTQDNEEEGSRS